MRELTIITVAGSCSSKKAIAIQATFFHGQLTEAH